MTDDSHLLRSINEFFVPVGSVALPAPETLERRVCVEVVLAREAAGCGGRNHR
jgi:hypothetical protein